MPARHHRLSAVLAAKIGQRQVESVILADRAATAVDRAISRVWRQLLGVLAGPRDWAESYHAALRVLGRLTPAIAAELGARLHGMAEQGHKSAAKLLAETLPLEYLRAAAISRGTTESANDSDLDQRLEDRVRSRGAVGHNLEQTHRTSKSQHSERIISPLRSAGLSQLTEGEATHGHAETPARLARPRGGLPGDAGAGVRLQVAAGLVALIEGNADEVARTVGPGRLAGAGLPDPPRGDVLLPHLLPGVGGVELHAHAAQLSEEDGDGPLDGSRLRVPARVAVPSDDRHGALVHHRDPARLLSEDEAEPALPLRTVEAPRTAEHWRELFRALLFPPPPLELLRQIVFAPTAGQPWTERISSLSRLAPAEVLASIVANGMAAGKMQREIAQEILPQVNNVRASASRVARTEGIRVLNVMQERAHEQLGDLVMADQVHAVLDQNTRSWHAARSGTIYYRDPKPGQKGPRQQPHPPQEAADASERPAGTPATAPNCRCVTGNALIHADVRWIARSLYDGEGIEIRTRGGARLVVTANHPIATPEGFLPANQLRKGDYLFSDACGVRDVSHDVKDRPTTVEDAFQALAITRGHGVAQGPHPLEFHGDGQSMYGEVHIVGPDLGLMLYGDAALVEGENHRQFIDRATSTVGGLRLVRPLPFRHARPFEGFGGGMAADGDAIFNEHANHAERASRVRSRANHAPACQSVRIGERFQRFPGKITFDEVGRAFVALGQARRFCFAANRDPEFHETPTHGVSFKPALATDFIARSTGAVAFNNVAGDNLIGPALFQEEGESLLPRSQLDACANQALLSSLEGQAEFLRDLTDRFAGFVSLDEIIYVHRFHLQAPVYSVDTGLGYYMGSDNNVAVIQGNCYVSPVLRPPEHIVNSPEKMAVFTTNAAKVVPDPTSYSQWFERADDRRRRIAVGSRRYDWAKQEFGPDVGWETFVGPKGNLLGLKALKAESDLARGKRIAKVRDLMARRAELIRQTSTFGFLAPAA